MIDFLEFYIAVLAFVLFLGLLLFMALAVAGVGISFHGGHYILAALAAVGIIMFASAVFALPAALSMSVSACG